MAKNSSEAPGAVRAARAPHRRERLARTGRLFVVCLLILPLVACATKRDVRDLQERIEELNAEQAALLQEVRADQRAQRDSIRAVARSVQDSRTEMARRMTSFEDLLFRIQELAGLSQQQVASLRDQIERERARSPFGPPGPEPGAAEPGSGGAAEELYDAAVVQFNRGSFSSARMGFDEIVSRFPNDPLAPEARYYLADILVQQNDPERAIEVFLEIPEFHPDADRVPDALYRAGMLHMELGNDSDAVRYLDRVVNTWPDSAAAELAREALDELR